MALLLAVPAAASAVEAQSWSPWLTMREIAQNVGIMLVGTEKEWSSPDVEGDYAVFIQRLEDVDGMGPGTAAGDWDVYLYNLSTRTSTAIATGAGDQTKPRVDGDWVVYLDLAAGNSDVKAYQISTGVTRVVASGVGDQDSANVSGTRVVYETNSPSQAVRMFDLSTNVDSLVVAGASEPAISGNRIVYIEAGDVRLRDLTNGLVTQVTADAEAQTMPRIDGDHLVFLKSVGILNLDVQTYTISTNALKTVATAGTVFWCDVDDTKAVWETLETTVWYLQGYDFMTNHVVTLANADPKHLHNPMIDGNNVVVVHGTSSAGNINLGTLAAPVVSLSFPSVDSYGAPANLTGALTENGVSLGGKTLDILQSTDAGHTWAKLGETITTASGSYAYLTPATYRMTWYRVRYNGESEGFILPGTLSRFSALSSVKAITPRASLGRPTGYPSYGKKNKYYSVYGSLKPRQTAAPSTSKLVVIRCYRKNSKGKYIWKKTVSARVYNYSSYSRYRASVKLPFTGKWRMRAYFQGTDTNAAKYSSYRYVRVK